MVKMERFYVNVRPSVRHPKHEIHVHGRNCGPVEKFRVYFSEIPVRQLVMDTAREQVWRRCRFHGLRRHCHVDFCGTCKPLG